MEAFGRAFSELIKKRGMSVSAVAAELGMASKTALFRVLNGQSRPETCRKYMEAARASERFALTDEEYGGLKQKLREGEMDKQTLAMNELLRELLHSGAPGREPSPVPLEGKDAPEDVQGLLDASRGLSRIHIDVLGRCPRDVLSLLHRFSGQADVASIRHIFAVDDKSTEHMRVFAEASSILFSPVYSAYVINETGTQEKNWLFHSGLILLGGLREDGGHRACLLAPVERGYHLITGDHGEPEALFARLIGDARERIRPLKRIPKAIGQLPFPENYVCFTEKYLQIERGRRIYMIKPDVPLICVPPDLLLPIVRERFAQEDAFPEAEAAQAVERLCQIHRARYDNLFGKRKQTHMVLSREAMLRFAQTGVRQDHVFLLRPYTRGERTAILENLRDHMRQNPNLNVWFGKSPSLMKDKEVTAYEGYGVAIIKSDTSWHLEKDHQEIMLESRALASRLRDYLLGEILPKEVFSREESMEILEQLIKIAREG